MRARQRRKKAGRRIAAVRLAFDEQNVERDADVLPGESLDHAALVAPGFLFARLEIGNDDDG